MYDCEYDLSSSCYLSYFVYTSIYNTYCSVIWFSVGRKYASLINFTHQHFGYRYDLSSCLGNNFLVNKIYPHIHIFCVCIKNF